MANRRDIQEDINFVNEFKNNAARAMGLRMQIVRNRMSAIRLLEHDLQSKDGLALLKRTAKNEKWFNRIIENGLAQSFDKLKEVYALMRKHVKDRKAKNNAKRLISLVEYFYSKFKDIDKRLQLEEAFLEREDQESFKRFVKEWEKDFEIRRKVINKITRGSDLVRYFKQKLGFLFDVLTGGAGGVVGGLAYNEVNQFFFGAESLTKEQIALLCGGLP